MFKQYLITYTTNDGTMKQVRFIADSELDAREKFRSHFSDENNIESVEVC